VLLVLVASILSGNSCNNNLQQPSFVEGAAPKNIILLVGDGMGLAQVSTSFYFNKRKSNFLRFKEIGLHQNNPSNAKITDSAAGATAFSAGVKSYNGAIGVDKDTQAVETIIEILSQKGLHTGVVSTSSITHATPASFYAHVKSRRMQEEIAEYLVNSKVDFIAGGGQKFFNDRKDSRNLLEELKLKGFTVETEKLAKRGMEIDQKYAFLLAPDYMPKMQQGRGDFLPNATNLALDYLAQAPKGFFLLVEGSQIDWGGHANDANYIIEEMKDFDKTIGEALDFAEKDGNTLVVVTADHETGGFALSATKVRRQDDYRGITPTFSTGGHTAALIPVFAYGPGAERFKGIYQNRDIFAKMLAGGTAAEK
ncbi:MAG: alkaline phosphatase, partial [Bacteroidota bacterium]